MNEEQVKETRAAYTVTPEKHITTADSTTRSTETFADRALSLGLQIGDGGITHQAETTPATEVLQRYPLPVDADQLRGSVGDIEQQIAVYTTIAHQFEARHGCSLDVFERRIAQGEVPEHPSWEESLEWGAALDEVERLRTIREALQWILNLLP